MTADILEGGRLRAGKAGRMTNQEIEKLVAETGKPFEKGGAYSSDSFTSWKACVRLLSARGYRPDEAEAILRSKWMRWASDNMRAGRGRATSQDLARFLDDPRNQCTIEAVRAMI